MCACVTDYSYSKLLLTKLALTQLFLLLQDVRSCNYGICSSCACVVSMHMQLISYTPYKELLLYFLSVDVCEHRDQEKMCGDANSATLQQNTHYMKSCFTHYAN